VVQPFSLWVALDAKIHTRPDAPEDMRARAREKAIARLKQYFNPWPDGGPQGDGWPFGRALYLSEVLGELEQVEGVDYVEDLHAVRMSTSGAPEDVRTIMGIQLGRCRGCVDSGLCVEEACRRVQFVDDGVGDMLED